MFSPRHDTKVLHSSLWLFPSSLIHTIVLLIPGALTFALLLFIILLISIPSTHNIYLRSFSVPYIYIYELLHLIPSKNLIFPKVTDGPSANTITSPYRDPFHFPPRRFLTLTFSHSHSHTHAICIHSRRVSRCFTHPPNNSNQGIMAHE